MIQIVELHYRRKPKCDFAAILARASDLLESPLASSPLKEADKQFLVLHSLNTVEYDVGPIPAQTALLLTDEPTDPTKYEKAVQQSWGCRNAADLLQPCKYTLLVTEMLAHRLEPDVRIAIFHGVLQATIELTKPTALVFVHTQQVIAPADYLKACDDEPIERPGSLNVRLYNIENSPNGRDKIMDTRGLAEVGLHDLQCHFHDLEPSAVARLLMNLALYIFEHGAVIESGHTIAGLKPKEKWRCQFENALLAPEREVLDVNPGPNYAAGNRH